MPNETMYDSVNTLALPLDSRLILAYIDGRYNNYSAVRQRFPAAVVVKTTTLANGSTSAVVYDCERGDGNASQAADWAARKLALHERPTIYCSRIGEPNYGWPWVQHELLVRNIPLSSVDFGIADYTGVPHLVPLSSFTQYANPPGSGGDFDISLTNGIWPLEDNVATPTRVAIRPTSTGKGYWVFAADGGVFAYGDAKYLGSLPGNGIKPVAGIVDGAPTPTDGGYWLLGADGGVFAFGNAPFLGAPNS